MSALAKSPAITAVARPRSVRLYCGWSMFSVAAAALITLGVFIVYTLAQHNFHVVSAGQVYRSAQLDVNDLTHAVQDHGIKSILNLRGGATDSWYNAETNASYLLGVQHYDFRLFAGRELKDEEMDQILTLIENAPKPLLIHCKSGADRTGLVGALYLYTFQGKTARESERELTLFCGHVPYLFWRDTIAMDRSFSRYVRNHAQASDGGVKFTRAMIAKED